MLFSDDSTKYRGISTNVCVLHLFTTVTIFTAALRAEGGTIQFEAPLPVPIPGAFYDSGKIDLGGQTLADENMPTGELWIDFESDHHLDVQGETTFDIFLNLTTNTIAEFPSSITGHLTDMGEPIPNSDFLLDLIGGGGVIDTQGPTGGVYSGDIDGSFIFHDVHFDIPFELLTVGEIFALTFQLHVSSDSIESGVWNPIPEPSTFVLAMMGLLMLSCYGRRRRRR